MNKLNKMIRYNLMYVLENQLHAMKQDLNESIGLFNSMCAKVGSPIRLKALIKSA